MNLFIDTHLNDVVILLENNGEVFRKSIISDKRQNSTVIMPTIKKVLDGIKPDSIIVVNGPGSFTGVRLGVTIAKTLAYTMEIPIRSITSLEMMAVCLDGEKTVAFSDNNGYYVGTFDKDNNLIGEYIYLSNSEYNEYSSKHNVITDISYYYEKIIGYTLTKKDINPHSANPIYIKKLDVEK